MVMFQPYIGLPQAFYIIVGTHFGVTVDGEIFALRKLLALNFLVFYFRYPVEGKKFLPCTVRTWESIHVTPQDTCSVLEITASFTFEVYLRRVCMPYEYVSDGILCKRPLQYGIHKHSSSSKTVSLPPSK